MNQAKRWVFFIVFIMLFLTLYLIYRRNNTENPSREDLSGGATVQRQRIDRAIDTASGLSAAEAIDSLHVYSESYALALGASLSPASLGVCYLNQVLADRRASKIFEYFLSLDNEDASQRAVWMFDSKLELLRRYWQTQAEDYTDTESFINLGPTHHATSVAAFFCSYFCSPDVLDEKLQQWDAALNTDAINQIEGVTITAPSRFVDPLFRLTLLAISGNRSGASIDHLNKELDLLSRKITGNSEPFLQAKTVNVFKWNAETIETDFTHVTRGIPASTNSILLELPGFSDPNSWHRVIDKQVFAALEQTINTWRRNGASK